MWEWSGSGGVGPHSASDPKIYIFQLFRYTNAVTQFLILSLTQQLAQALFFT